VAMLFLHVAGARSARQRIIRPIDDNTRHAPQGTQDGADCICLCRRPVPSISERFHELARFSGRDRTLIVGGVQARCLAEPTDALREQPDLTVTQTPHGAPVDMRSPRQLTDAQRVRHFFEIPHEAFDLYHGAKIICIIRGIGNTLLNPMISCRVPAPLPFVPNDNHALLGADLFCGAGGFSLGALRAGFKTVISCERNPHACATYRHNFERYGHRTHLAEGDITRFTPHELMDQAGIKPGELDIVIGGPPCQGFSVHNPRNRLSRDKRNHLVLTYLSLVEQMRPKYFLIENVPGLLRPGHRWVLNTIRRRGAAAGFIIEGPAALNARDFGVPQNRQRVFLLGRRRGIPLPENWPPKPTHFSPTSAEVVVRGLPAWRTARVVFDRALPNDDPDNRHMKPGPALAAVFAATPHDGGSRHESGRTLACHATHDGHSDVYGRIDTTKPGPTMTTACVNPSKGRFVHPWEDHGITVRHAARLQSFPDDFVFSGGLLAAGEQVGNAVPPELGHAVLQPIAECLMELKGRRASEGERTSPRYVA